MKAKVKRIDGYILDDKLKCPFCKSLLYRGSWPSDDKLNRLVCRTQGCGRYLTHAGYAEGK